MTRTSPPRSSSHPTVGVLGGGQLALMLAEAGKKISHDVQIFTSETDAPASAAASRVFRGEFAPTKNLRDFLTSSDVVTFENEFVDCDVLVKAAPSARFIPSLDSIRILQDKLSQKQTLARLSIPNADFIKASPQMSAADFTKQLATHFPEGCVLKWSRMGYDGKGVLILKHDPNRSLSRIETFMSDGRARGAVIFAERRISYRRELALVAARSLSGDLAFYPLVVSEQEAGICKWVTGPATALGTSRELEEQASQYARILAEALDLHGTFALELFETGDENQLLVNEIAPRVHNSGHFSIEACPTSQFENHLRAVAGMPLGAVNCAAGFVMLNLLGSAAASGDSARGALPELLPGMSLHWYGKSEMRPLRKMGHVTAVVNSPSEVETARRALADWENKWKA